MAAAAVQVAVAAKLVTRMKKMRHYKLDDRLQTIANFTRKGVLAADIGCDHGHLICYLAEQGIITGGYACDINVGPLQSAQNTIQAAGLQDKITTLLCDGLRCVPKEVEEIIIAGMGGELIAKILLDAPFTRDTSKHFILQPMTKAERLRKQLLQNGFTIEKEEPVTVGKFVYTVLSVYYTGEKRQPDLFYCYTGQMPNANKTPQRQCYFKRVMNTLQKKLYGANGAAYQTAIQQLQPLLKEAENK